MIGCRNFIFRARFTAYHNHVSLLTFIVFFFILFHSCCSHARVFGKTLVHEFLISSSHTEWYLLFSDSATSSAQCVFGAKNSKLFTSKPEPLNETHVKLVTQIRLLTNLRGVCPLSHRKIIVCIESIISKNSALDNLSYKLGMAP